MPPERLVHMLNQIARAFAIQGEARAVPAVANHLRLFWEARMLAAAQAHLTAGGEGLLPIAAAALRQLGPTTRAQGPSEVREASDGP